jgi:ATP-dependent Clp protease adaptor protein ClpS
MSLLSRALLTRLENVADSPGVDLLVADLQKFAIRQGWAEVQPEDLAAFVLHDKWSYRARTLLKAYKIDRSTLPCLRRSDTQVSAATLSHGCVQVLEGAVNFAAINGRPPEQLRYSDVVIVLCMLKITAPLMENSGLTKLKVVYFLSHRTVLPEAIDLALPPRDRDKPVRICIHNDNFTPMDVVTNILNTVFQLDEAESRTVMVKVHEEGRAFLGPFKHDLACELGTRATAIARAAEHPLLLTLAKH